MTTECDRLTLKFTIALDLMAHTLSIALVTNYFQVRGQEEQQERRGAQRRGGGTYDHRMR